MIVKMIENLENKMELQLNSLETRIEKMQERFNKDLEEIKKSQYIMNNAINEFKNTLEGTNSRIVAFVIFRFFYNLATLGLSCSLWDTVP